LLQATLPGLKLAATAVDNTARARRYALNLVHIVFSYFNYFFRIASEPRYKDLLHTNIVEFIVIN
jgi:hypothetical protein